MAAGPGTEENLTYVEIGKRVGVTAKTIREWRGDLEFQEYQREAGTLDTSAQVEKMLVEHAVGKGSERHAKLWIDKYGPKDEAKESKFDTIFGLTDDDLSHIRLQIHKHMQAVDAA